jgi:phage terminase large subunit-like protein
VTYDARDLPCPPRWSTPRTDRPTRGARSSLIARALGRPYQPHQQHVADVAGEVDPATGLLVFRTVVVVMGRQSGKTNLWLPVTVERMLGGYASTSVGGHITHGPQVANYTAQTRLEARLKWLEDHVPAVERSPLGRLMEHKLSAGDEHMRWPDGSRYGVVAPTWKAGHGQTADLVGVDEAWALPDSTVEQGVRPAMITRAEPQLWVISAAGTPDSLFLAGKMEEGRAAAKAGVTSGVAYFEWSAPEDADPSDPEVWRRTIPALQSDSNPAGLITEEAIAEEFRSWETGEFSRAYLAIPSRIRGTAVIAPALWSACEDRGARHAEEAKRVGAFDVSPERDRSSVGVIGPGVSESGEPLGVPLGEVTHHDEGTEWVPAAVASLRADGVTRCVYDATSPAAAIADAVRRAGMRCEPMNTTEVRDACGQFYDGVRQRQFRHVGQPGVDAAINGAARSERGDAWRWSRKSSACDITPLMVLTLAYGHLVQHPIRSMSDVLTGR